MGWTEYSTDRLDPATADDVDWISSLSLGGLSNYWTAAVPRFAPADFLDGKRLDERYVWPITYDDLVPHYEQAERALTVTAGDTITGVPSNETPLHPPAAAGLEPARRRGHPPRPRRRHPPHGQGTAVDGRPPGHRVLQLPLRRSPRCSTPGTSR